MRHLRRTILLSILAAAAAACQGSSATAPSHPTHAPTSSGPTAPATITPGSYVYRNAGLTVTLQLNGHNGSLAIDDQAGHDLGPPGIYVLNASTGARVNGRVIAGTPVSDGASATFKVQFPSTVNDHDIGLVILMFGALNYGAMAPG